MHSFSKISLSKMMSDFNESNLWPGSNQQKYSSNKVLSLAPGLLLIIFLSLLDFSACRQESGKSKTSPTHTDKAATAESATIDKNDLQPFIIQVAAFNNQINAEKLTSVLHDSGFPVFISLTSPPQETLYRVRIGPFKNERQAHATLSQLEKLGYMSAYLVKGATPRDHTNKAELDTLLQHQENAISQLTTAGHCEAPKWSPNGREIAFFKREENAEGIYSIGTGGGQISQIVTSTKSLKIVPDFAWSPEGDRMAFVAIEEAPGGEDVQNLYAVRKDGTGLQRLTQQNEFPFEIRNLKWAPDGQHMAFNAYYGKSDAHSDILQKVILVSLTSGQQNLELPWGTQWCAGWDAANQLIVLTTYGNMSYSHNYAYEVWSHDPNTHQSRKMLSGPAVRNCQMLRYLPETDDLIYSAFEPVGDPETGAIKHQTTKIIVLNLHTGQERTLFETQQPGALQASFLVASEKTLFLFYENQMFQCDLEGNCTLVQERLRCREVTLSPDGSKICFEQNQQLFIRKLRNKEAE
ncbi:MAG: SPOR domain-containing protein [bacterium]